MKVEIHNFMFLLCIINTKCTAALVILFVYFTSSNQFIVYRSVLHSVLM